MLKVLSKAKVVLACPYAICLNAPICTAQGCTNSRRLNFRLLTGTLIGYLLLIGV